MSIAWMVFVAGLIAVEKLLPWRAVASRGIALVLAVLAIAVAFTPADVPSLTIPGSPDAMQGMESMDGSPQSGSSGTDMP
jgi:hypothetical protein